MGFSLTMMFVVLANMILPILAVIGVVVYIRRSRRDDHALGDGSIQEVILDSLDQIHVRLDAMNDRMTRLEETKRLEAPSPPQVGDGRADGDHT